MERAAEVCVLANTVKDQLFPTGEDAVGKVVKVSNFPCKVIGVLEAKGISVTGQDQDNFILLPYTTAQKKLAGITWLKDIMCSAVSPEAIPVAKEQIIGLLRDRHRIKPGDLEDFNMRTPEDVIKARMEANNTMATAADRDRIGIVAGRRHRHHECDAGVGDGANARDRREDGSGSDGAECATAVSWVRPWR